MTCYNNLKYKIIFQIVKKIKRKKKENEQEYGAY